MKGYGNGKAMKGCGLLPGQHKIPFSTAAGALHDYMAINKLNPHEPLPHHHALHIATEFAGERGGAFFLPLAIGALAPLISKAVGGLVDKIAGRGLYGSGPALYGSGVNTGLAHLVHRGILPRKAMLNNEPHWIVHGDGFGSLIKSLVGKILPLIKSEPVRKFGRNLGNTVLDGLKSVISGRIESLFNKGKDKANEFVERGYNNIHDRLNPQEVVAEIASEGADGPAEGIVPQNEVVGTGYRRRRNLKRVGGAIHFSHKRQPPPFPHMHERSYDDYNY